MIHAPKRVSLIAMSMLLVGFALSATAVCHAESGADDEAKRVEMKTELPGVKHIDLVHNADGTYEYELEQYDGHLTTLSPDAFAARVFLDRTKRPWHEIIFNITSPIGFAWVALGLLGQVLFTGRMVVQWLASEKHRRSVVPVAFWWMSLSGATMLMIYFVWRKDVVGILGQATGWGIYVRNLWMIYRTQSTDVSDTA